MGSQAKPQAKTDSRTKLEQAALRLGRPDTPPHARAEALGTLLSAFALGSRTAKRGLEEYRRVQPQWIMPSKEDAMTLANEAFREAETLKAEHQDGETRPGF